MVRVGALAGAPPSSAARNLRFDPACTPFRTGVEIGPNMSRTSSPLFVVLTLTFGVALGIVLDRGHPFVAAQATPPAARPELSANTTTPAVAVADGQAKASSEEE